MESLLSLKLLFSLKMNLKIYKPQRKKKKRYYKNKNLKKKKQRLIIIRINLSWNNKSNLNNKKYKLISNSKRQRIIKLLNNHF